LKRKRGSGDGGEREREREREDVREANEEEGGGNQQSGTKRDPRCDVDYSGRSKKKAKLSHGFGYSFGDRKFRADATGAEDGGVKTRGSRTRSTIGLRRSLVGNKR
jgi:hypothetical protein